MYEFSAKIVKKSQKFLYVILPKTFLIYIYQVELYEDFANPFLKTYKNFTLKNAFK